jgi:hypothetical protein
MKITVKRLDKQPTYTVGEMYLDNQYLCDTLEDRDRGLSQSTPLSEIKKIKVMHRTAIPTGTYKVILNFSPSKKRLLPKLEEVPCFSGILIHRGNSADDSSGCIIIGEYTTNGKLINSTKYENELVEKLQNEKNISITIE